MGHQTSLSEENSVEIIYGYNLLTDKPMSFSIITPPKLLTEGEKEYMNSWQHSFLKIRIMS